MDNILNKIIGCGYEYTRLAPMLNQIAPNACLLACGIINIII